MCVSFSELPIKYSQIHFPKGLLPFKCYGKQVSRPVIDHMTGKQQSINNFTLLRISDSNDANISEEMIKTIQCWIAKVVFIYLFNATFKVYTLGIACDDLFVCVFPFRAICKNSLKKKIETCE